MNTSKTENRKAKVVTFPTTPAAREELLTHLKKTDQILLKGSHSMNLESLLELLQSEIPKSKVKFPAHKRVAAQRH